MLLIYHKQTRAKEFSATISCIVSYQIAITLGLQAECKKKYMGTGTKLSKYLFVPLSLIQCITDYILKLLKQGAL